MLIKCVGEGEAIITATLESNSKCSESFKVTVSDTYVNYPVDLGIANNPEHTLVDGTVPKTDWRIFYQDGTYTYLIAADYIPVGKIPKEALPNNNGQYNAWWVTRYVGAVAGATPTWEYKNRFLFNSLSSVNSSNANYKATTYLLNTDLWSDFTHDTYADACIGGPTLEMICSSWNKSTPNEPLYWGVNSTGYTIGKSSGDLSTWWTNIADYNGFSNTLYYPHNKPGSVNTWNNSYGYWLSSPSARDTDCVMIMFCEGTIGSTFDWNNHDGIRPVVCLKSTTKLIKDSNGIWQLSVD